MTRISGRSAAQQSKRFTSRHLTPRRAPIPHAGRGTAPLPLSTSAYTTARNRSGSWASSNERGLTSVTGWRGRDRSGFGPVFRSCERSSIMKTPPKTGQDVLRILAASLRRWEQGALPLTSQEHLHVARLLFSAATFQLHQSARNPADIGAVFVPKHSEARQVASFAGQHGEIPEKGVSVVVDNDPSFSARHAQPGQVTLAVLRHVSTLVPVLDRQDRSGATQLSHRRSDRRADMGIKQEFHSAGGVWEASV